MIDDSKKVEKGKALVTQWVSNPAPQIYADEATLAFVGDHMFITLGQMQAPVPSGVADQPDRLEIQAVAKIVLTAGAFHKLLSALNRVAPHVRNPLVEESQEADK
jgi:hypothetical protein